MKRNNILKKALAIFVSVIIAVSLPISALAVDSTAVKADHLYKNVVILGDSICLGFSAAGQGQIDDEFNIAKNALENRFKHSYPSQLAEMLGLDTSVLDDGKTELYNFGICAAWSSDIYELLTDPFYYYSYCADNYDENTTFVLPRDFTDTRYIVDTSAEGYDIGDPSTWVYETDAEGNYVGEEEYTIPAGTEIHVAYKMTYDYGDWGDFGDFGDWGEYLALNNAIARDYMYLSRKCTDANGNFIDTNGDGTVDESDIIYYPTKFDEWSFTYVPKTNKKTVAQYGEYFANPKWTDYYYDLITDSVKNGDLIILASGGNDIYHSFMPYQQDTDSTLGLILYMLTQALSMGMTVGDMMDMMSMIGDMDFEGAGFEDFNFAQANVAPVANTNDVTPANVVGAGVAGAAGVASLINEEEITKLLDLYSRENIDAYMADVVADYRENLEKTILRINELRGADSEFVLMKHYNPFGMENYIEMLAQKLQDPAFKAELCEYSAPLFTLLQAIVGKPGQMTNFKNMSSVKKEDALETARKQLEDIVKSFTDDTPEADQKLTNLLVDLSYPLSVLLVGNGLSGVYESMNAIVDEMADKYDLVAVDITGAPTSGGYDPHPTAAGHAWIADKLYKAVAPTITASVSKASKGSGTISAKGETTYRLRDSAEYQIIPATGSVISAIFIDGEYLDPTEYANVYSTGIYAFDDIRKSHTISVQFDYANDFAPKYIVDVLGGYDGFGGGAGLYKEGTTVNIDAGELEGYEFTGWVADSSRVIFDDASSPVTSFKMPKGDVKVIATWRPLDELPPDQKNTLSFETNWEDFKLDDVIAAEGTEIDLDTIEVPEREGYTFAGWYFNSEFTARLHKFELNNNMTVYAKWIKDSDIKPWLPAITASVSPLSTGYGTLSSLGVNYIEPRTDKEFRIVAAEDSYISAIFVDGIYLNPFDPANASVYKTGIYKFDDVTNSHTLMVQFDLFLSKLPRYAVNIAGSYADAEAGEGLYSEGDIVYIDAGELPGYEFAGWEVDGDVELADPEAAQTYFFMPDSNVSVKAKWTPVYNIYFETNGGSEIDKASVKRNSEVDLDEFTTERENFEFAGWYLDEEFNESAAPYTSKGNITLYAKWQSTVTFDSKGGSEIEDVIGDEGSSINLDDYVPTRDGYTFDGWYSDKELTERVTDYTFAGDITVYAKWNRIPVEVAPKTADFTQSGLWATIAGFGIISTLVLVAFVFKPQKETEEN